VLSLEFLDLSSKTFVHFSIIKRVAPETDEEVREADGGAWRAMAGGVAGEKYDRVELSG